MLQAILYVTPEFQPLLLLSGSLLLQTKHLDLLQFVEGQGLVKLHKLFLRLDPLLSRTIILYPLGKATELSSSLTILANLLFGVGGMLSTALKPNLVCQPVLVIKRILSDCLYALLSCLLR